MFGNKKNIKCIIKILNQIKDRKDFNRLYHDFNDGTHYTYEDEDILGKEIQIAKNGIYTSSLLVSIVLVPIIFIFEINILFSSFVLLGSFLYLKYQYTKEVNNFLEKIDKKWISLTKNRKSQNLGIKKDNFRIDDLYKILREYSN